MERKETLITDERTSTDERPGSDEGLSTRDLASPSASRADARESAPDAAEPTSSGDIDDAAAAAPVSTTTATSDPGAADMAPAEAGRPGQGATATGGGPSGDTSTAADLGAQASTQADTSSSADTAGGDTPLVPTAISATFQQQWEVIQTRFVDEPRGAVEEADGLVATLMKQLAEGFAMERERLEAQWDRGEDISTEDLRLALQRYRSFFQRLLST